LFVFYFRFLISLFLKAASLMGISLFCAACHIKISLYRENFATKHQVVCDRLWPAYSTGAFLLCRTESRLRFCQLQATGKRSKGDRVS